MKKAHLIIAVIVGGGVAGMRLNIISPKKYLSVQRKCIINLTTWVGHTQRRILYIPLAIQRQSFNCNAFGMESSAIMRLSDQVETLGICPSTANKNSANLPQLP